MSANQFPALHASSAREALAVLARYERHVRRLTGNWLDMDLYNRVSEEIDEVKRFTMGLPALSYPFTALLISHADLIHALWARGLASADGDGQVVARRLEEHLNCIDVLARHCVTIAGLGGMEEAIRKP